MSDNRSKSRNDPPKIPAPKEKPRSIDELEFIDAKFVIILKDPQSSSALLKADGMQVICPLTSDAGAL